MSFYRSFLTAIAVVAIASPVFADDAMSAQPADANMSQQNMQQAGQPAANQTKININTASIKELKSIKGLDSAKARAIIAYRKKHGDFKSLDDLTSVKGMSKVKPDTMKAIQEQLSLQ
jgi:competence protein ComEA